MPNSDLLVDKIAEVAFGSVPGDSSGAIDVGIAPAGTIWFRAQSALQFACGVAYSDTARKKLVAIVSDDGAPDGFHRGKWKVGGGAREGGLGSWSVEFANLKNFVKTQVRVAREDKGGGGARAMATHLHVNVPDDLQVDAFLGDCREANVLDITHLRASSRATVSTVLCTVSALASISCGLCATSAPSFLRIASAPPSFSAPAAPPSPGVLSAARLQHRELAPARPCGLVLRGPTLPVPSGPSVGSLSRAHAGPCLLRRLGQRHP
jgi:hypothetical protein